MRAITIVLIVLSHSVVNIHNGFPVPMENTIRGITAVFVFISGFFFHAVFYPRFEYRRFIQKKLINVFVPFVVVSTLGLAIRVFEWSHLQHHPLRGLLLDVYYTVGNGYVLYPHWYIPFVMAMFLLAPLHMKYISLPPAARWGILGVLSVVAVLVQRPMGNVNVLQSVVYYTPYYLFGILYSIYKDWFYQHSKYVILFGLLGFGLALWLQSYVFPHVGNYNKPFFDYAGVDISFIQKLFVCVLLVAFCKWLARWPENKHLSFLGASSFAVFFLHPFITMLTGYFPPRLAWVHGLSPLWASLVMTALLLLIQFYGTVLLAVILKKATGRYSRWLIGW